MSWILEFNETPSLPTPQQPPFLFPPPPPPPHSGGFNLNNKISPTLLLIIIIISIIIFVSGLLHLLVRLVLKQPNGTTNEMENDATALHGQLQQLFHLHDAGVDQSFIDATLPVFDYKAIVGVKDPFDCAVCLCEFECEDNLRLLPKCSHAFHVDCIDTWLLSHSNCPLCRTSLVMPDFSSNRSFSPMVMVLESRGESSREIGSDREMGTIVNSSCEIQGKEDEGKNVILGAVENVVSVKLGKFKSVDHGGGEESGGNDDDGDARRCFSMGSFAYVMDENLCLQVTIGTPHVKKKQSSKKGIRVARSECGCDSRREFMNGFEGFKILETRNSVVNNNDIKCIARSKRESFSVSKIWLRGRGDKPGEAKVESSRRAFSLRFPVHRNPAVIDEIKHKNVVGDSTRAISEIDISSWENGESELVCDDDEMQSLDSQDYSSSFARRTLIWLRGKQNKIVHSTFSSNV